MAIFSCDLSTPGHRLIIQINIRHSIEQISRIFSAVHDLKSAILAINISRNESTNSVTDLIIWDAIPLVIRYRWFIVTRLKAFAAKSEVIITRQTKELKASRDRGGCPIYC